MTRPTIGAIARQSRLSLEHFARRRPDIGYEDMNCYCAIGSYILTESLRGFGYSAHLRVGFYNEGSGWADDDGLCHAWVEVDGKSVDITATQFRGIRTPVLIYRVGSRVYRRRYHTVRGSARTMLSYWGNQNPWEHQKILDRKVRRVIDILS